MLLTSKMYSLKNQRNVIILLRIRLYFHRVQVTHVTLEYFWWPCVGGWKERREGKNKCKWLFHYYFFIVSSVDWFNVDVLDNSLDNASARDTRLFSAAVEWNASSDEDGQKWTVAVWHSNALPCHYSFCHSVETFLKHSTFLNVTPDSVSSLSGFISSTSVFSSAPYLTAAQYSLYCNNVLSFPGFESCITAKQCQLTRLFELFHYLPSLTWPLMIIRNFIV